MTELTRILLDFGASDEGVRRLFRAYADNVRRLAMAEADLYLEELEKPWAGSGVDESELKRRRARAAKTNDRESGPCSSNLPDARAPV